MATLLTRLELLPNSTIEDLQTIIRGVYKHVLGNPHIMESERLLTAESQLCNRSISVKEFVRLVAKSDFYKSRYFESCAPYRFVELNFRHLLGRAPQDQREVSEHIVRCVAEGYDAEIDSYIDSEEYQNAFGENTVPFDRGTSTEANYKQVGYNRMFALDRGAAQIDSAVTASQLVYNIATNSANKIKPAKATVIGSGTEKRFKIVATGFKFDSRRRVSTTEYLVSASKMTPQIQRIQRSGGRIVSIREII
ncbi:MAG: photosystem I reaction center subunit XII [Cyanobacteria bacterium M5B4]|nr:phycobilisome rod-core linker polypeptide [Cyanobacteria bacterium KgW148]PLS69363.1 MAG: photosystem I reaction center subunit XII [Cyanobacteria bacterium M5B4]